MDTYKLGRFFYRLSIVEHQESENGEDFNYRIRAGHRETTWHILAACLGYSTIDHRYEQWEKEGLI